MLVKGATDDNAIVLENVILSLISPWKVLEFHFWKSVGTMIYILYVLILAKSSQLFFLLKYMH